MSASLESALVAAVALIVWFEIEAGYEMKTCYDFFFRMAAKAPSSPSV